MTDQSINPAPPDRQPPQAIEDRTQSGLSPFYAMLVGALLVVIIVALAFLWTSERRARVEAQQHEAEAACKLQTAQSLLLGSGLTAPAAPEEKTPSQVTLDGRPRRAVAVPAEVGERLGFDAGDVVIVQAASRPANAKQELP